MLPGIPRGAEAATRIWARTRGAVYISRLMRKTLVLSLALAALAALVLPTCAGAQRRPLYAGFGIGPHAFVTDHWRGCCDANFRVSGEFGWHPSGDDSGFFLAGEAIFTAGDSFVMFLPALRLGGDIEVHSRREITVFLRPSGALGGGFWDARDRGTLGLFFFQPAFDLRLALARHLIQLWLRPLSFDFMFFPDWYGTDDFRFVAAYSPMVGLDFAF